MQHLFFISAIIKNSKNTQANIIYLLITKSSIKNEAQNNVIINKKLLAIAINFSKDNFFNIMKITSFLNLQNPNILFLSHNFIYNMQLLIFLK